MSKQSNPSLDIYENPPKKFCGGYLQPLDPNFPLRRTTPYFNTEAEVVAYKEAMNQTRPNYFVFEQDDWLVHIGWNLMGIGPYTNAPIKGDITTLTLDEAIAILGALPNEEVCALWQAEIEAHEFPDQQ